VQSVSEGDAIGATEARALCDNFRTCYDSFSNYLN